MDKWWNGDGLWWFSVACWIVLIIGLIMDMCRVYRDWETDRKSVV